MFSKNNQKGFTFVELTVIMALLLIITTIIVLFIRPDEQTKRARDEKRLSDISSIDRAINEFLLDNKRYPDQEDTLRQSNILPTGSPDLNKANLGWIYDDLSRYLSNLPTDPTNNAEYFYSYYHDSTGYEINARLESYTNNMSEDGGNDPSVYEVGNNLNLILP